MITNVIPAEAIMATTAGRRPASAPCTIFNKGAITGSEKKIYSVNGSVLMHANIENLEVPPNETRNVRCRQYILFDGNGNKYAVANPLLSISSKQKNQLQK